jgi:chemotaxis protein methyltransferase CheR
MDLLTPIGTESLIRDLVMERTGMLYDKEKTSLLLEKLSPLVIDRGFHSFLDYYYLLKYDDAAEEEWRRVIDAISVQETFFWREIDQVRALVDILVPQWAAAHDGRPLRIWSAACASGEEPLTIAMALNEAGWFDRLPIEIIATDGSGTALQKAKGGIYRERAFRNLSEHLREKYFQKEGQGWKVDSKLHSRISWSRANLVNRSELAMFTNIPFIFCRNVFIYFSADTIRRVVKTFADYGSKPTYLFVGISESLLKVTNDFELIDVGKAFVYQLTRPNGASRFESLKG